MNLQEAFEQLNLLEQEEFDVDVDDLTAAGDFASENTELAALEDDSIDVIDPEADSEDDLEDSYIGKVILDCCVCHSKIYKNASDISIDENSTDQVNIGEECPYCYSSDGFKILGQVKPFKPEEIEDEDEDEAISDSTEDDEDLEEAEDAISDSTEDDEDLEEAFDVATYIESDDPVNYMTEELNGVDIVTDKDTIHVEAHSLESEDDGEGETLPEAPSEGDEIIGEVAPEAQSEILGETPIEDDVKFDASVEDSADAEIPFDDVDEESFSELGERYLKSVYSNVAGFKLNEARFATKKNALILEGTITFTSGVKKATAFIFEGNTATKSGKVTFKGYNKQIHENAKKALTLRGRLKESKLIVSSMSYNYSLGEGLEKAIGTVRLR